MKRLCVLVGILMLVTACSPQAVGTLDRDAEPTVSDAVANEPAVTPTADVVPPDVENPAVLVAPGTLLGGGFILDTATGEVWDVQRGAWHVWAPSGNVLAVYRGGRDAEGVTVVDMATGNASVVAGELTAVNGVAWSPDGEQLAFVHIRDGAGSNTETDGVYVVNRDGTGLRRVADGSVVGRVAWSADGRYLAFSEGPYDQGKVTIVAMEDGAVVHTVPALRNEVPRWQWSSSGAKLAWVTDDGYGVIDAETGMTEMVHVELPIDDIHWQDDGVHALMADPGLNYPSFTLSHRTPAGVTFNLGPVHWRTPVWRPGADQVAFISDGCAEGTFDLMLIDADGTGKRPLTEDGAVKTEPVWRPDGGAIAFGQIGKLVIANVDDGELQVFLEEYEMYGAPRMFGWSADGRYVLFRPDMGRGVCD